MKNFSMLLAALTAFLVISCSHVDDSLIGQLDAHKSTLSTMVASNDATTKKIAQMVNTMEAAPANIKGTKRFVDAYEMLTAMNNKWQATLTTVTDMAQKAQTLADDYQSGKIKTDDVKKEVEIVNTNVSGLQDLFTRIGKRMDDFEGEYKKMEADYAANPSSFEAFVGSTMTRASPVPDQPGMQRPAASGLVGSPAASGPPDAALPAAGAGRGLSPGAPQDKKIMPNSNGTIDGQAPIKKQ
ncbi:MAG: hypothetical protein WCR52_01985 [Bacteroidota bacterium]